MKQTLMMLFIMGVSMLTTCRNNELQQPIHVLKFSSQQRKIIAPASQDSQGGSQIIIESMQDHSPLTVSMTPVPTNVVSVRAKAGFTQVDGIDSPSVSDENSQCTFEIVSDGAIPNHDEAKKIKLYFSKSLLSGPFVEGSIYTFRFLPTGEFFDVAEVPPSY